MYTRDTSLEPLLPLLQCPNCHARAPLEIRSGAAEVDIGTALHHEHLFCRACATAYPITEDFIPILWDADLRRAFVGRQDEAPEACSAIAANKAVYDRVSDQYDAHSRRKASLARRMQHAAKRILAAQPSRSHGPRYHLDYGCGPGHVIGWLKEWGFRQIGLDVSVENLRNARKHTGCLVVCGNACRMPFADQSIDLVTESAVLHHIPDWKSAVREAMRICKRPGGIILDSEPTKAQMAWSRLAILIFNLRFPIYRVLSLFKRNKYIFRDPHLLRLNLQAEVHNQPGKGFPLEEIEAIFAAAGFHVDIVQSLSPKLTSKSYPTWKNILLGVLSFKNPWNSKYGSFTAIASSSPAPASVREFELLGTFQPGDSPQVGKA